jgi:hypothetical protein
MRYNNPLPRLNLTSPYPDNTKDELDMRRKAEVLKHQGPQKSTQMNTLTKNQKFAQVVRGYNPAQKALRTNRYTLEQMSFCDSSNNRTLSSSSDVPGKPIFLYMDPAIPLYNYVNEYRTYSNQPRPVGEVLPWRFFADESATSIESAIETNIGVLEVLKDITSELTNFTINIPGNNFSSNDAILLTVKFGNQQVSYSSSGVNPPYTYVITPSNIYISNIQLYTIDGFFYEFFVKLDDSNPLSSTTLAIVGNVTITQV